MSHVVAREGWHSCEAQVWFAWYKRHAVPKDAYRDELPHPRVGSLLWSVARIAGTTLAIVAVGVVMLTALQRRIIFPRHLVRTYPGAGDGVRGLERLWLDTDEGRVEAWLLPGDGATADRPGPAAIMTHGNAELIDDWPRLVEPYRAKGVTVLLPEYRGYGRSAGSPSQEAITADLVRFHDLLAARPEVDATRIVFHGRSLGGGAVCALAAERAPAALILMSTFTSVRAMARELWLPGFLVQDPFDNLAVVERYGGPLLIAHGTSDETVPVWHGKHLHRAAAQSRLVLYEGANHNNTPPDWRVFWEEVWKLLGGAGILER